MECITIAITVPTGKGEPVISHSLGPVAHCACTTFGTIASKHDSARASIGMNGDQ